MTKESFQDLVKESNSIPWNRNWSSDVQPGGHSASEFMKIARDLRVEALLSAKKLLERVPNGVIKDDHPTNPRYYSLESRDYHGQKTTTIDDLITEISKNDAALAKKAEAVLNLNAALLRTDHVTVTRIVTDPDYSKDIPADPRFLKSEKSLMRKLEGYQANKTDHPEKIGDYLRMQVLFDTAEDLAVARHELQFGDSMAVTSQKDKLRRPDEDGCSGHRSFMAHAMVGNDKHALKCEVMLSLYDAETFEVDKSYRDSERTSLKMASACTAEQGSLSNAYFNVAGTLMQLRKIAFYDLYSKIDGMNALLDEDVDPDRIRKQAEIVAEFQSVSCAHILGKLPTVVKNYPAVALTERRLH